MSVREYIGARYVPLFADPIDWDSTKTYEPLTVVYNQGNSYTSRQYVPAGIDISNDTYWARTGNYNAQIEQYRREVQAFDGRITANAQAIADEVTARMAEDTAIRGIITDLQGKLSAETTRAKEAEQANATAISAETTRAKEAEQANATAISAETTRAKEAEQANATAISAETTRATNAITAEATARKSADTALETRITDEVSARESADAGFDSRIVALEKRAAQSTYSNLVCIGDSWLEGYSSIGTFTSWGTLLAKDLDAKVYNSYKGGCGFSQVKDGVNFTSLVNSAKSAISDPSSVNCLVIGGGINDRKLSAATVKSAAATCITTALNSFPNADIFVFPMMLAGRFISTQSMTIMNAIQEGCASVKSKRVKVYGECYDWLYDNEATHADSYHPNQLGQNIVADYMRQVLYGGSPTEHNGSVPIKGANGFSLNAGCFVLRSGNICSGYIATTGSPTDGKPFCSISNGYSVGAYFGFYTNAAGELKPMNSKPIGSDSFGFAPSYGNANQMYAYPSWAIQDND